MKKIKLKNIKLNRNFIKSQSISIYTFLKNCNSMENSKEQLERINNMNINELFNYCYPEYDKYKDTDLEKALGYNKEKPSLSNYSFYNSNDNYMNLNGRSQSVFDFILKNKLESYELKSSDYYSMYGPCIFDKGIVGIKFFDELYPNYYILKTVLFNLCLDVPKLEIFIKKCIKLEKTINKQTNFSLFIVPILMLQIPHIIDLFKFICDRFLCDMKKINDDDFDDIKRYNEYINYRNLIYNNSYYKRIYRIYRKIAIIYFSSYEKIHFIYKTYHDVACSIDKIFSQNSSQKKFDKRIGLYDYNFLSDNVIEIYLPTITPLEPIGLTYMTDLIKYTGNNYYASYNTYAKHLISSYNAVNALIDKSKIDNAIRVYISKCSIQSHIGYLYNNGLLMSDNPNTIRVITFDKTEFKEKDESAYKGYNLLALFSSKPELYFKNILIQYNDLINNDEMKTDYEDAIINYLELLNINHRSPKYIGKANDLLFTYLDVYKYDVIRDKLSDEAKQKILIYQVKE